MQEDIEKLIRLNIEIEGLLRVALNREHNDALQLLNEKYLIFNNLIKQVLCVDSPQETSQTNEKYVADDSINPSQDTNDTDNLHEKSSIPTSDFHVEKTIETEENSITDENNDSFIIVDEELSPIQDPATLNNIEDCFIEETADSVNPQTFPVSDTLLNTESPSLPDNSLVNSEESAHPAIAYDDDDNDEIKTADKADIRVDELLSRKEARDLKRAFTLNDKFRFRRGLFGNNDSMFADTLNTLMAMKTFDEASEYLYVDMAWDPEDEDVKDFVAIVKNHFAAV